MTMIDPPTRLRRAILHPSLPLVTRLIHTHPSLLHNPDFASKANTSLHLAAAHNHADIVSFLLSAGHEEGEISRNTEHETPLMLAARGGAVEAGRVLVKMCPGSVGMRNARGEDAVMIACQNPAATGLIPLLLQTCGLEAVDRVDNSGNTPLHHASASGSLKALRILLGAGAKPFEPNGHDWTPLAYSQTVAAEVYFKNLVAELERRKAEGMKAEEERVKQRVGGLRVVGPDEEGGGGRGGIMESGRGGGKGEAVPMTPVDDEDHITDALKRHWSPTVERKRPVTPGSAGKAPLSTHEWDARLVHARTRSSSGG
ncbi:Target of rapamycin complex 2 subunit avo2 [Saxophila tyrrhenica]|uniref:Target of rapamycin complex 2 subunit avo2 n=1 Tax=Saxophila tyrrhenica TaxID=1690608 RepID=A0AAV9P9W7_9PEZI|nr:Target of rapamycin complex 2 subunit avo2 [Saxophila tyrrhenica]